MQLVFINDRFPYGKEPFVESEIPFLPEILDGYIVPLYPDKSHSDVPKKIKELTVIPKKNTAKNYLIAFKRCFSARLVDELNVACRKKHCFYNIAKAIKFCYTGELQISRISGCLKKTSDKGPFLFYSYWMYQHAYIAAGLKEKIPGSRFITRCHGYDLYEQRHPNNYIPFRKFIFSQADYICPISLNGKNYFLNTYGHWFEPKIHVVRLGTVLNNDLKPYRGKPDKLLHIVSCSSMTQVKRLDRLIASLAIMQIKVEWTHFGDGDLREHLQSLIEKLPNNISCNLMGARPNQEILEYYKTHDVDAFINTSESEGVPVSMMEAMSCRIPVIATDVGGVSEIVHDGINGILIEGNFAPETLAKQLECFAKLPQGRIEELRMNARTTWEESYDASKNYRSFFEFLNQQALL